MMIRPIQRRVSVTSEVKVFIVCRIPLCPSRIVTYEPVTRKTVQAVTALARSRYTSWPRRCCRCPPRILRIAQDDECTRAEECKVIR